MLKQHNSFSNDAAQKNYSQKGGAQMTALFKEKIRKKRSLPKNFFEMNYKNLFVHYPQLK